MFQFICQIQMASKGLCEIKITTGEELQTTPRIVRIWYATIMLSMPFHLFITSLDISLQMHPTFQGYLVTTQKWVAKAATLCIFAISSCIVAISRCIVTSRCDFEKTTCVQSRDYTATQKPCNFLLKYILCRYVTLWHIFSNYLKTCVS
jgi:hypothetical protein